LQLREHQAIFFLVAREDGDGRTGASQAKRDRPAYPAVSAGDDGDTAAKVEK
jgi:hypothetical protein